MIADPAAGPPDRRRSYPYPRALRRVWRHPAVQSMNGRRLSMCDDLRGRLESYASRRARFRSGYDRDYYTARDIPECRSHAMGIIRPGDMGAAVLYALGIDSYEEVRRILSVPDDPRALPAGTDARSQAALIKSHIRRRPALAVDMGCGRGEVAATLAHLGINALAVDPSAHAEPLVEETARRFYGLDRGAVPFEKKGCYQALKGLRRSGTIPDAVIFCESIEHMPEGEVWRSFELMSRMAPSAPRGAVRVVVTNWIDLHPIRRIGRDWDHLHDVDDAFYDRLESYAARTVFRRGSHLVLELGPGGTPGEGTGGGPHYVPEPRGAGARGPAASAAAAGRRRSGGALQ